MIVRSEKDEIYELIDEISHDAIYRIALKSYSHKTDSSDISHFVSKLEYLKLECRLLLLKAFEEFKSL